MIVLDSNVISELMHTQPNTSVIKWLDVQPSESIWTTSVSVYEILFGINILSKGKRRQALQESFEKTIAVDMKGQVLDFDTSAAYEAATISAKLRSVGRSVEIRDVQIAGIVAARRATLATRNTKHFFDIGVLLVNPWD